MANQGKTDFCLGTKMQALADGGAVIAVRGSLTLPAASVANDVVSLVVLPADHVPVDFIYDSDDIDTGTSNTVSVGVLNAAQTDLLTDTDSGGAVWLSASTTGQTAGIARPTTSACVRTNPLPTDRNIGAKIIARGSATAGVVGLTLFYRRANAKVTSGAGQPSLA